MTIIQLAGVLAAMLALAWFWMVYLIKIVLNDDHVQEKIRRILREREEKKRAEEDRQRMIHKHQKELEGGR